MSVNKVLDRRIQRTRQLLQEALFHLIIERGYESITILDITEQANLGRTTFYLHYREKEELLREGIKALLRDMQLDVEPMGEEKCDYSILSIRIFQHVAQRQQLYRAMLKESGPANSLGEVMRSYFIELCQRFLLQEAPKMSCSSRLNGEIFAAHAAGSLFGLISWWLDNEVSPSAELMGTTYCQLMMSNGKDNLATSQLLQ
jgi:AcrR family transcriptional regulator